MPARRVPRAFSLPWGKGMVVEEAAIDEGLHAPSIQLLHYELGEKQGQYAIRFAAFDDGYRRHGRSEIDADDRIEQRPLIVNERELGRLRSELELSPRLKALLTRLVEG